MPRLSDRWIKAGREAAVLALIAGVATAAAVWYRGGLPRKPDQTEITLAEALRLGPLWLDARPEEAFLEEHVPGALSLSREGYQAALPGVLERWEPNRAVVVYDDAPGEADSREVAARLCEFKLGRVCVLSGGWKAWKAR